MRLLIGSLLSFFLTLAFAGGISDITPRLEKQHYQTLEEAATHGLAQSYMLGTRVEYGGLIYQNTKDHTYAITVPITDNKLDSLSVPMWVKIEGYKFVADYHTHVCNVHYYPQYFSPSDIMGNKHIHDIGFIANLCNGDVHEFDPSRDISNDAVVKGIDDNGEETTVHITAGRIVGRFPVVSIEHSMWERFEFRQFKKDVRPDDEENPHPALDTTKHFNTIQEAALYGLAQSVKLTRQYEAGGIVLQNKTDRTYQITVPYTSYNPARMLLPMNDHDFDKDYTQVAWFHTHACVYGFIHGYFSGPDAAWSQYFKIRAYMMNNCSGNAYLYDPAVDKSDDVVKKVNGGTLTMTSGRMIGWINRNLP